jgi:hypothetical protein
MRSKLSRTSVLAQGAAYLLVAMMIVGPINAQVVTGTLGSTDATTTVDGRQLPAPAPKFGGVIKETAKDSTPWWPPRIVPPKGAPNVLLIMTDDQGYGVPSTFGSTMPDKLNEMQALFQKEAADHQVLPLDNSGFVRALTARPSAIAGKTVFTYTGENANIPDGNAPNVLGKNFTITADVTIPSGGAEGMVVTEGGMIGGYGLYLSQSNNWWLRSTVLKVVVWGLLLLGLLLAWIARRKHWTGWKTWPAYALILLAPLWLLAGLITGAAQIGKGRPIFVYNMLDLERFRWSGPSLSAGKHTIIFDFKYDGVGKGGTGVLTVDGEEVDRKAMEHTIPFLMPADESFDVGLDTRTPVDFAYDCPFRFTGTIDKLTYNLGPSQLSAEDQKKVQDAIAKIND